MSFFNPIELDIFYVLINVTKCLKYFGMYLESVSSKDTRVTEVINPKIICFFLSLDYIAYFFLEKVLPLNSPSSRLN